LAKGVDVEDEDEDAEIQDENEECGDPVESVAAFKNLLIKVLTDNELD